jgi:alpha-1,2-mannosyltransferase
MIALRFSLLAAFLFSFALILKTFFLPGYPDFSIYYEGTKLFLEGGNPYLQNTDFFAAFIYPPFSLIALSPLTFVPYFLAAKIWNAVSICALVATVYLMLKLYGEKLLSNTSILIFSLAFIYFPVKYTLGMGQFNLLTLFLTALGLYYLNKKKEAIPGFLFAVSLLLKLFPPLLIPYLFIRKLGTFQWVLVFLISFSIITYFTAGYQNNLYYAENVIPSLLSSENIDYYNQSLSGFLLRTIPDLNFVRMFKPILTVLLTIVPLWLIFKKKVRDSYDLNLEVGLIIILNLIINSFSWQHHFVWMIIPYAATFFYLRRKKYSFSFYLILLVSYILTAINLKNPEAAGILELSHVFYGALILYFMNLYLCYVSFKHTAKN